MSNHSNESLRGNHKTFILNVCLFTYYNTANSAEIVDIECNLQFRISSNQNKKKNDANKSERMLLFFISFLG